MRKWVALLRGVNVGGANRVPMPALRALATDLGWQRVRSHIASGNLVFAAEGTAAGLAEDLRQAMAAQMGVDVAVLVLSGADLRGALSDCPFDPPEGKQVHGFFLFAAPVLDPAALEQWRAPREELVVRGRVGWLYAPDGIGRSKLAERLHKVITGTDMTARNLNTLRALVALLEAE